MKVFVSTTDTQGQRKSDFCFVPEGEGLYFGFICDTDKALIRRKKFDEGCGCGRCLIGVKCGKGTTTFKVIDIEELTLTSFATGLLEHHHSAGYKEMTMKDASELASNIVMMAEQFPEDVVLEKRGFKIVVRDLSALN